jgi:hypothetical protein
MNLSKKNKLIFLLNEVVTIFPYWRLLIKINVLLPKLTMFFVGKNECRKG